MFSFCGQLKEFKAPEGFQSAPLVPPPLEPQEGAEVKWVSEGLVSHNKLFEL